MPPRNLWGELSVSTDQKPPITILKEQAEILSSITGGILNGQVSRDTGRGRFFLTLSIFAPALNYSYEVLQAQHPIELYPVSIQAGEPRVLGGRAEPATRIQCNSEKEFEEALAEILSSSRVKSVIAALLVQSKA